MSSESDLEAANLENEQSSEGSPQREVSDLEDEELSPVSPELENLARKVETTANNVDSDLEKEDSLAEGDDLFGSESDDDISKPKPRSRQLDDEDLDSGDDEERYDRADDNDDNAEAEEPSRQSVVMEVNLGRHAIPDGTDGELYVLKFPSFLGLEPYAFEPQTFQPPQADHHTSEPSPSFSPFATARSTVRWRKSPKDASKLESNARIVRWSDGSLTMQLANDPKQHFELPAKPLAPPQFNPPKPTPTSKQSRAANGTTAYNAQLDSHTYLTTPHESAGLLRITNHVTTALNILPSSEVHDEALIKLQQSLEAAKHTNKAGGDSAANIITVTEDPDLARKKAEIAERDRLKNQRRIQSNQNREAERISRTLAKSGLGRPGGLSVGGLEDDDMMAPMRMNRKRPGAAGPKRRAARNRDSDTDEDMPRGHTREDEYDKTDDFLVDSDEEEEEEAERDEDEEEASLDAGSDDSGKHRGSPKRVRSESKADAAAHGPRGKRRRVIEDEDEDE
ncbi:MAG: hypothetical protein M1825_003052 [Sarcosagium campestre]|nr:MAG: hypothetical protein M1825_003052 [Sarcosagium campestre]